jgi:hypothetical protein
MKMKNKPVTKSVDKRKAIDLGVDRKKGLVITNEEAVNEFTPPKSFSENERIRILAEIMEIATHSRTNSELYEGCIQKIFAAVPNAARATILVDMDGELFPVKYSPREQAYHSETHAKEARDKRKAFSWARKYAEGVIPRSTFDAIAAMYAPMIRNGNVVGVLHADSFLLIEGFSKSELDMLSVIASVLALSFQPTGSEYAIPSVFISYSHKDSEFANKLKGDLRRNGISVWIDERLRVADAAWRKQLEIAIRGQRYFLFLMTPECIKSEYCQWELKTAHELKKTIIPLLMDGKASAPGTIADLQHIDFTGNYEKGLSLLTQAIYRDLG